MKARIKIVDVFTITGRGNVIVSTILEGSISKGDMIIIGDKTRVIQGVEMFSGSTLITDVGLLIGNLDTKESLLKFKDTEVEIIPFNI